VCTFRSKYHKLKYGTDLDLGDMTPPSFDKDAKGLLVYLLLLFSFSKQQMATTYCESLEKMVVAAG